MIELTIVLHQNIVIFGKCGTEMIEIGQRMKQLREVSHLSQVEVARLSGSSQATIAKMESGKAVPSLKILLWWADHFDVSLDYLCCRTEKPQGKLYECKPKITVPSKEMKQFIEMCFDPKSPMNERLKQALLAMMEDEGK